MTSGITDEDREETIKTIWRIIMEPTYVSFYKTKKCMEVLKAFETKVREEAYENNSDPFESS